MRRSVVILLFVNLLVGCTENNDSGNYYFIHGRSHIFKVYAPHNWINDAKYARSLGIASFFHPEYMPGNSSLTDIYIYAQGWDKANKESSFEHFIKSDQEDMRTKYKNLKITKRPFHYNEDRHIKDAAYFVIENIPGRYREDCIFLDTDKTIVNIVYSGVNRELYDKHRGEFSEFVLKFVFLSSSPDEIRRILEKDKIDRPWVEDFFVKK